jgi:hypothetical protein
MRPFDDSFSMTPDERRAAIAKILAAGILRLHTRAALPYARASSSEAKNNENPGSPRFEVPDETVLSVHNG